MAAGSVADLADVRLAVGLRIEARDSPGAESCRVDRLGRVARPSSGAGRRSIWVQVCSLRAVGMMTSRIRANSVGMRPSI